MSGNDDKAAREVTPGGLKAIALAERGNLLKFLAARRMPKEEAEDILQDLFVNLEVRAVGPVAEPRGYLYRMLDNLLLDRRRGEARRAAREDAWVSQAYPLGEEDERPSVDAALIGREEIGMIAEALSGLPDRTRRMFYRTRVDGLSRKQVAAEFGISVSAVEKHLQKAYEVIVSVKARLAGDSDPQRRL